MANTARLGVLEKHLGISLKRHKDPGKVTSTNPYQKEPDTSKEETVIVKRETPT